MGRSQRHSCGERQGGRRRRTPRRKLEHLPPAPRQGPPAKPARPWRGHFSWRKAAGARAGESQGQRLNKSTQTHLPQDPAGSLPCVYPNKRSRCPHESGLGNGHGKSWQQPCVLEVHPHAGVGVCTDVRLCAAVKRRDAPRPATPDQCGRLPGPPCPAGDPDMREPSV